MTAGQSLYMLNGRLSEGLPTHQCAARSQLQSHLYAVNVATVLHCRIKAKRQVFVLYNCLNHLEIRNYTKFSGHQFYSASGGALSSLRPNLAANLLMRTVMFLSVPGSLCSQKLPGANLGRTYSQACLFSQHTLSFQIPLQATFSYFPNLG